MIVKRQTEFLKVVDLPNQCVEVQVQMPPVVGHTPCEMLVGSPYRGSKPTDQSSDLMRLTDSWNIDR